MKITIAAARDEISSLTLKIAEITEEIILSTRKLILSDCESKRIENQPHAIELLEKGKKFTKHLEQLKRENVKCDYLVTREVNLLEAVIKAYIQIVDVFVAVTKGKYDSSDSS